MHALCQPLSVPGDNHPNVVITDVDDSSLYRRGHGDTDVPTVPLCSAPARGRTTLTRARTGACLAGTGKGLAGSPEDIDQADGWAAPDVWRSSGICLAK